MPNNVIALPFGEHARAQSKLQALGEWPPVAAEGLVTLHSDGEQVQVLQSRGGQWQLIASFVDDHLQSYLADCRVRRWRLLEEIRRLRCRHTYRKGRRRCTRCGHMRKPKWTRCKKPKLGTEADYRAGRACAVHDGKGTTYTMHGTPPCRRRKGHPGPCSWAR